MKMFNKASRMLSDFFKYDEDVDNPVRSRIEDDLIYLNSQVIIWKEDLNFDDDNFNQIFSFRFNKKFMVYNLMNRKIDFRNDSDKIVDFKAPDYPSYTLEFLLTFAISAKNWLSLDSYNILIVHDDLKNPRVISLICSVLSYINKNTIHPMDLYANIISTNKAFEELANINLYKNVTRYINYFSYLQNNPLFEYKKLYLKSVIINGAPAIENSEINKNSHYITINDNSFYKPVIRIISNDKISYCSYRKNQPVESVLYSGDNSKQFDVSQSIFGDTLLEVLHHSEKENKFKQLFVIQFHTFFVTESGIRFTKDQIDGICKDIRYPDEFFIDLMFDENKSDLVSTYDDDVSKWKNIISDFIMKGFKNLNIKDSDTDKENNIEISRILNNEKEEDINQNKDENISNTFVEDNNLNDDKDEKDERDEDLSTKPNTINKAQEILQKFSKSKDKVSNDEEEEDEDEEDFDNYLKNLENKNK